MGTHFNSRRHRPDSRTQQDVNTGHISRRFPGRSIVAYLVTLIAFIFSSWVALAVSLLGGLLALWTLDAAGLSNMADSPLSGVLCLCGFPLALLAAGLCLAAVARGQRPVRLALLAGALGIIVGAVMALTFVLTGGWSEVFA